jgi:hypothetical protein
MIIKVILFLLKFSLYTTIVALGFLAVMSGSLWLLCYDIAFSFFVMVACFPIFSYREVNPK